MDEVIADSHGCLLKWLSSEHGYFFNEEEKCDTAIRSLITTEHCSEMESLLHDGKIFSQFDVMPGAQQAIEKMMDHFEIFIVTAAMEYPASCAHKFSWLRTHFPFIPPLNIVFCGDKSIVATDLLLDDSERHFNNFRGQGILFSAPHNRASRWPVKVSGWREATNYLESWRKAQSHDIY